jgi:nucleoside 2-deoxyribosyltransferase
VYYVNCPACGTYRITPTMDAVLQHGTNWADERHLFAGLARRASEKGETLTLHSDVEPLRALLSSSAVPKSQVECMDLLLVYLKAKSTAIGARVQLDFNTDFPISFSPDPGAFEYLCGQICVEGYADRPDPNRSELVLTMKGWQRAEAPGVVNRGSNQAFVAMWFDDEMDEPYRSGFEPALTSTGWIPFCMKYHHHNNKIDDVIVSKIRESGLLVADFTQHRGGVYFEAGFAKALGIPVIWTCMSRDKERCHFDTNHYNHIFWTDPKELKDRLLAQIRGTNLARK